MKFEQPNNNFEKQKEWDETTRKVESITDDLGKPVDSQIKETVAAFMVNDLDTSGSCEGHLDRGRPYPFIHVDYKLDSPELLQEITVFREKMNTKGYENFQDIPEIDKDMYNQFIALVDKTASHKNEVQSKIDSLLKMFYTTHQPVSKDALLRVWEGGSFFEISPISGAGIGKKNWERFEEKEKIMSSQLREQYLKNSQNEMKAFTMFLKQQFFKR